MDVDVVLNTQQLALVERLREALGLGSAEEVLRLGLREYAAAREEAAP